MCVFKASIWFKHPKAREIKKNIFRISSPYKTHPTTKKKQLFHMLSSGQMYQGYCYITTLPLHCITCEVIVALQLPLQLPNSFFFFFLPWSCKFKTSWLNPWILLAQKHLDAGAPWAPNAWTSQWIRTVHSCISCSLVASLMTRMFSLRADSCCCCLSFSSDSFSPDMSLAEAVMSRNTRQCIRGDIQQRRNSP